MTALSLAEIQKLIPERREELMVDRVLSITDTQITAHQTIALDASYFQGHFPGSPVVPGVLLVEGLQQTAKLFLQTTQQVQKIQLSDLQRVKFRKMVEPGSELTYEISLVKQTDNQFEFKGTVLLEGEKACQARITLLAS